VLWDYLRKGVTCLGIEPSAAAAETAAAKYGRDRITHSTAEDFGAFEKRWDCIVFNEVLYYFTNPLALLRRYSNIVKPGGVIIISIHQKQGNLEAISNPRAGWADLLTTGWPKKALKSALFKTRLLHRLDRRRPMSGLYCSALVDGFMLQHDWVIEEDQLVPKPATTDHWRIWCVRPQRLRSSGTP